MKKNKQIVTNTLVVICVIISFFVGSLVTVIVRNHKELSSETAENSIVSDSAPISEETAEAEKEEVRMPHQLYFITSWDKCLDQLRIDCDVAFLGDSITYQSYFFQDFPDLVICNLGVCSDTIKAMNSRVATLQTIMPEHVFLMIGTNSLRNGNLDECVEDYKELVDNILSRWDFKLYLVSITPRSKNSDGEDNPSPELIASFNEAIAEIAEEKDAVYLDLYSRVVDDSGYIKDIFTSDGLHLADPAYEEWSKMMRPYLEND